jgi:hypothetical protein
MFRLWFGLMDTGIGHFGAGVPGNMEGEEQPILIVMKAGSISFFTASDWLLS